MALSGFSDARRRVSGLRCGRFTNANKFGISAKRQLAAVPSALAPRCVRWLSRRALAHLADISGLPVRGAANLIELHRSWALGLSAPPRRFDFPSCATACVLGRPGAWSKTPDQGLSQPTDAHPGSGVTEAGNHSAASARVRPHAARLDGRAVVQRREVLHARRRGGGRG